MPYIVSYGQSYLGADIGYSSTIMDVTSAIQQNIPCPAARLPVTLLLTRIDGTVIAVYIIEKQLTGAMFVSSMTQKEY